MNDIDKLEILEQILEPTPYEMELDLITVGYDRDFLESLTNDQLRHLYYEENPYNELDK